MILVAEDDLVTRAYALGEHRLLTESGERIDIPDGAPRRDWRGRRRPLALLASSGAGGHLCRRWGTVGRDAHPSPGPVRTRQLSCCTALRAANGTSAGCTPPDPGRRSGGPDLRQGRARSLRWSGALDLRSGRRGRGGHAGARRHPRDRRRAIGLAGFSNGMWSVPMIAARRGAAFLTGVGSPGVSMAESEIHRRTKVLRDAGVGPATVAAVAVAWRCIFAIVGEGLSALSLNSCARRSTPWRRRPISTSTRSPTTSGRTDALPGAALVPVDDLIGMLGEPEVPGRLRPGHRLRADRLPDLPSVRLGRHQRSGEASVERIGRASRLLTAFVDQGLSRPRAHAQRAPHGRHRADPRGRHVPVPPLPLRRRSLGRPDRLVAGGCTYPVLAGGRVRLS